MLSRVPVPPAELHLHRSRGCVLEGLRRISTSSPSVQVTEFYRRLFEKHLFEQFLADDFADLRTFFLTLLEGLLAT